MKRYSIAVADDAHRDMRHHRHMQHFQVSAWSGVREDGGLLLPLPAGDLLTRLPEVIDLPECRLERKSEAHVTALNREWGARLVSSLGLAAIEQAFLAEDWTLARTGNARLLRKTKDTTSGPLDSWSLIEELKMPAMASFRGRLSEALAIELPAVLPHVTLYVSGDLAGIGLPDMSTVEACTIAHLRIPSVAPRHPPELSAALLAAYRATGFVVTAPDIRLKVDEASPAMDQLLTEHAVDRAILISADNPFSEAYAIEANQIREAMLRADVMAMGFEVMEAVGRDPECRWHPEASLLVLGTTEPTEHKLLMDYEQHAILIVERGRPVRLQVHPEQVSISTY